MTAVNIKTIFTERKIKLIFCLFAIFLIFLAAAQPAHAFDADGVVGAATAGLKDFLTFASAMILWVIGGVAALLLTANVLQWVIDNQTTFMNLSTSAFVKSGLTVTQGLADMLLLLIFVVSAFGIIFKYRDFEAKKTLTKLVMVAILTRFGPLLVKMMTDIGNVAINTIMAGNSNLLSQSATKLATDSILSVAVTAGALAGLMAAYAIPILNLGAIALTIGDIATTAAYVAGISNGASAWVAQGTLYFFTNFVVSGIFEVFASFTLAGIFLTYILLFVWRIFMLQILAVLSPLAIMAYALPQTQHWFKQWWNSLVSWTFVGVYTLFFLVLGLGSANFIFPQNTIVVPILNVAILKGLNLNSEMFYYLFLIVYLSLVQSMANKDEAMGSMFRSAMTGVGGAAYSNMVSPGLIRIRKKSIQNYREAQGRIDSGEGTLSDHLLLHSSGVLAKASDDSTASGIRSMFSGDAKKASATAASASKNWDFAKLSNIDKLVNSELNEIDKDLTMDKAIAKGKKLNGMELTSIFKRNLGKKDEIDNLKDIFDANPAKAKNALDTMIREDRITPSQINWAYANLLGGKEASTKMTDAINKQDHNKAYLTKIQKLNGGAATTQEAKEKESAMLTWALANKGATTNKDSLENLSELFEHSDNDEKNKENKEKLLTLLAGGDLRMFGNANKISPAMHNKLGNIVKDLEGDKLKNFAKANPELLAQMANSARDDKFIPKSLRENGDANGAIDYDALSALVGQTVTPRTHPRRQQTQQAPPTP